MNQIWWNYARYVQQMEFSFSTQRWIPRELLEAEKGDGNDYALGLHAPGFFDKVLSVNKCLLQSEPANQVCWVFYTLALGLVVTELNYLVLFGDKSN